MASFSHDLYEFDARTSKVRRSSNLTDNRNLSDRVSSGASESTRAVDANSFAGICSQLLDLFLSFLLSLSLFYLVPISRDESYPPSLIFDSLFFPLVLELGAHRPSPKSSILGKLRLSLQNPARARTCTSTLFSSTLRRYAYVSHLPF